MKTILTCCIALFLLGCKTQMNAVNDDTKKPVLKPVMKLTAKIGMSKEISAPFTVSNCRIEGNTMFVDVSYSGGCVEHTFRVIGDANVTKSMPPIRNVKIIHSNNGDNCEALVTQTLEIDIKELAFEQKPGNTIKLSLQGCDLLTYIFN